MSFLDPQYLLATLGPLALLVIMFAETGLLIGFFLPGDSLLFTAGLLTTGATGGRLSLTAALVLAPLGALAGAQVGYLLGRRFGPALIDRPDRPRLQRAGRRAQQQLHRYGAGRAVVLARFIPGVRTVMNPLAGAVGVPARTFTMWQAAGGVLWTVGLVLAGNLLGTQIPGVDRYLLPVVALIVVVSVLPIAVELIRQRRRSGSTT